MRTVAALLLLLCSCTLAFCQSTNSPSEFGDHTLVVEQRSNQCPRFILKRTGWATPGYYEFQLSFNQGLSWEPLLEHGGIHLNGEQAGLPLGFTGPSSIDMTDVLERYPDFLMRAVFGFRVDNGYEAFKTFIPEQYTRGASVLNEASRTQILGLYSPSTYRLAEHRFTIDSTFQQIELRLQTATGTNDPNLSHWEVAQVPASATEPWIWSPIHQGNAILTLSQFIFTDTARELAVRPVLRNCLLTTNTYPDTAYLSLPGRAGGGAARASQQAICTNTTVEYTLEGAAATPFGWVLTLIPDTAAADRWLPTNPLQRIDVLDRLLVQLKPTATLSHSLELSPQVFTGSYHSSFLRETGAPAQYAAFALTALGRNWVASQPAQVLIDPQPSGGEVIASQVICRGNRLPAPLKLSSHLGEVVYWEASTDSLNWVRIEQQTDVYDPPSLETSTWFRARVAGRCHADSFYSKAARIEVIDAPEAGTIDLAHGLAVVCGGNIPPTLQVRNFRGNVAGWRYWAEDETEPVFVPQRIAFYSPPLLNQTRVQAVVEAHGCPPVHTNSLTLTRKQPDLPTQVNLLMYDTEHRCLNSILQRYVRFQAVVNSARSRFWGLEFVDLRYRSIYHWNEIPDQDWKLIPYLSLQNSQTSVRVMNWIGLAELVTPDHLGRYNLAIRAVYDDPAAPECGKSYSPPLQFMNDNPKPCGPEWGGPGECEIRTIDSTLVCAGSRIRFAYVKRPDSGQFILEASHDRNFATLLDPSVPCPNGCLSEPLRDTTYFRVRVIMPDGSPDLVSNVVRIDVRTPLRVGRLTSTTQVICAGELGTRITLSNSQGRIVRWEESENGTDWQTVDGTGGRLVYHPPVLEKTTWFRVRLFQCDSGAFTEPVRIIVNEEKSSLGGELVPVQNWVCEGQGTEISLHNARGRVLYWIRQDDRRQDTLFTEATHIETGPLFRETTFIAQVRNSRCTPSTSSRLTIGIRDLAPPRTNNPSETHRVCRGSSYLISYFDIRGVGYALWEISTDNRASWRPAPGSNPFSSTYTVDQLTTPTFIRRVIQDVCGKNIPLHEVLLQPYDAYAGRLEGPGSVCHNSGTHPILLTGTSQEYWISIAWEIRSPQGIWSEPQNSRGKWDINFSSEQTGEFLVRSSVRFLNCPVLHTEPHRIQVEALALPAEISGPARLCPNQPGHLTANLKGADLIRWERRAGGCSGTNWQIIDNQSPRLPISSPTSGQFCYRVVSSLPSRCNQAISPGTLVNFNTDLTPPRIETSQLQYCHGASPQVLRAVTSSRVDGVYWQQSTNQHNWTDVPGATGFQLIPPFGSGVVWYRAVAWSAGCGESPGTPVALTFAPQPLSLTVAEATEPECATCPTGVIRVMAEGGLAPYRYRLGNGLWQDSPLFSKLTPGTYLLTVGDAAGCFAEFSNKLEEKVFVCLTPPDLRVVETEPTALRVAWTPVAGARSYVVEIKPNTPAVRQWLAFPVADAQAGTHRLTGLQAGTTYVLRIRSRCPRGQVSENSESQLIQTPLARLARQEASETEPVLAYPNPTRDQLSVTGLKPDSPWQLHDLTGRLIASGQVAAPLLQLELQQLPAGIYLLQAITPTDGVRLRIVKLD